MGKRGSERERERERETETERGGGGEGQGRDGRRNTHRQLNIILIRKCI